MWLRQKAPALGDIDPGLLLPLGAVGLAIVALLLLKAADQLGWPNRRTLKTEPLRRGRRPGEE
jgi:hypothetical protein